MNKLPDKVYAQVMEDGSISTYIFDPRESHDNGKPVYTYTLQESELTQGHSKSVMRRLEQQGGICRECKIERGYRPILDYVKLCPRHANSEGGKV